MMTDWKECLGTFRVMAIACATCIYRADSPLDLAELEAQVAASNGDFRAHRICHTSGNSCCRGFWNRHKDRFPAGQMAQRLGCVEFVGGEDRGVNAKG